MPDNYSIPNLEATTKSESVTRSEPGSTSATISKSDPTAVQTSAPVTDIESQISGTSSIFHGNKGLLIAIVIAVIAGIIGISAFIGFNSSSQYQGLIKKVENETLKLKGK